MKRISLILLAILTLLTGAKAQMVDDALRYSQIFYGGTARFMSMGGAFTALGGDMSSLSQNPAGLGVYRSSEFTITPQLFHINTSAGYNGTTSDYLYNFNLNQIGVVGNLFSTNNETGLLTLNIGYSFNKTNNLNQNIRIQGINNTSSMADYWAGTSTNDGIYYKDLTSSAGIAYDTWVMDTITGSGGRAYGTAFSNYGDNPPSVYGQTIRRLVSYEGYTGEHALSIGGNYSNKIFFGATLGISKLNYTSHFEHLESTDQAMPSQLESFTYTDHYEDVGTGYNLKIGAIIKPIEALRIGLAFHSPTFYRINEYFYEDMSSKFTNANYESNNAPERFNYALTTPFRALAGVAVQIHKIALLSADYEFVDYSTAKFSETGDNYPYGAKNAAIKNSLKSASNIRLGGEVRLNKLYLRTGYSYYGKAFKSSDLNKNLNYNSISFGTGFREQNLSIDFAYTHFAYAQVYNMYPVATDIPAANADLSTNQNMFTLTLGYKFGY
jgi:hypothetical protein